MKKFKAAMSALLAAVMVLTAPFAYVRAEEAGGEEDYREESETEEEIPESYYYPIESNDYDGWPEGPAIEAASAIVMDIDTGTVLYSKQATVTQYPASITKIMTALIAIENCDLDETVVFTETVYNLEEGSTHLGIKPGEEMSLEDCLYGLLLASANDIAIGIAEHVGGSVSAFADMMNEKAEELGCVNTHFSNPHGLYSDDHYTCAYDMALIAKAAYENETFREIIGAKEYLIPETNLSGEDRSFLNHHQMMNSSSEYYKDWCTGGKTGYTSQCLNTLVTYGSRDGMNLVSIILRVNGSNKAYEESTEIMEYGFENFYTKKFEKNNSGYSFYDIIGLGYVGTAAGLLSPVWKRDPVENCSIQLTLPENASTADLTYTADGADGGTKTITYYYKGQPVGTATGKLNTFILPVKSAVTFGTDISESGDKSSAWNIQLEGLNEVLDKAAGFLTESFEAVSDYAINHYVTVLAVGSVLLIILIILIIVLIFRSTADARIRRKRRLEEEEKQKREEEIDRMTTAEIEAELRAVMEQERIKREAEERAAAEAEQAAREEEEMERKARETQDLIDELERERQEKISSDDNKGVNKNN